MDPKEIGLCWDLLDWVAASAVGPLKDGKYSDRVAEAMKSAGRFGLFPFSEAGALTSLPARKEGRLAFPDGCSLLLEPETKGSWKLPVLKISHDNVDGHEVVRYQVCLTVIDGPSFGDATLAGQIGVRFEMPEGPTGEHAYHHAQWCRCFHGLEKYEFERCPPWLPDVHPAIPVAAGGPLSLMVAMFMSLYGGSFVRSVERERALEGIREQCDSDESLRKLLRSVAGTAGMAA